MHEARPLHRVLMTADAVGGVFTYVLRLGALLRVRGVEVHVATMGPRPKEAQRQAAKEASIVLHESDYRLEWMDEPWRDVDEAGAWLLELEGRIQPDIVHLNGYCHASLPFVAPVVVLAHSCVLSWFRAVRSEPAPREWNEYGRRVRRGIHAADLVIAPTLAMLSSIEREYGKPRASFVIHHAIDAHAYRPASVKGSFVLAAGRLWDDAKNIDALTRVAPRSPFPILVAGAASFEEGPVRQPDGLQLLGELSPEDLGFWMARASIYALPARYEPFGLSVSEAALSGCALVLGDIDSLRELWQDAAIFVAPEDHEALEAALRRLATDAEMREDLAQRARARALELRPDDMASAYLRAYEGLLIDRELPASLGNRAPRRGGESCA